MHLLNAAGHYRRQLFALVWAEPSVFTQRPELNAPFLDQGFLRQHLLMKSQVAGRKNVLRRPVHELLLFMRYVLPSLPPNTEQKPVYIMAESKAVVLNESHFR